MALIAVVFFQWNEWSVGGQKMLAGSRIIWPEDWATPFVSSCVPTIGERWTFHLLALSQVVYWQSSMRPPETLESERKLEQVWRCPVDGVRVPNESVGALAQFLSVLKTRMGQIFPHHQVQGEFQRYNWIDVGANKRQLFFFSLALSLLWLPQAGKQKKKKPTTCFSAGLACGAGCCHAGADTWEVVQGGTGTSGMREEEIVPSRAGSCKISSAVVSHCMLIGLIDILAEQKCTS